MAFWVILTMSGLEVVWIEHEGCADVQSSTRFCTVLGSFLRVSLGSLRGCLGVGPQRNG